MATITQRLTLPDFLKLPNLEESPAWEFVAGVACQKVMPTAYHSILQKRLTAVIDQTKSGYEAFPELRCTLSQNSVVPDITVLRRERIPSGNTAVRGAPDWVIEILSPDQSTTKLIAKIQTCLQEGSHLGWLVDPMEQIVMVFWSDARIALFSGKDALPGLPELPLELTVEQMFTWLQPS